MNGSGQIRRLGRGAVNRLQLAGEEAFLYLLERQEESKPQPVRVAVRPVDDVLQIELVAGPDDVNLEDRLGKLDEDHEIVRDVSPRLLRHVAKEVKHEQFYRSRRAHGDRGYSGARVMAEVCGCGMISVGAAARWFRRSAEQGDVLDRLRCGMSGPHAPAGSTGGRSCEDLRIGPKPAGAARSVGWSLPVFGGLSRPARSPPTAAPKPVFDTAGWVNVSSSRSRTDVAPTEAGGAEAPGEPCRARHRGPRPLRA